MSLGSVVMEALNLHRELRAKGMTAEEADAALERLLREVWVKPHGRTDPWRYLCELCDDVGARRFVCRRGQRCNGMSTRTDSPHDRPGKYHRLCKFNADSDYEHDYIEPCVCPKGDRFRDRQRGAADFAEAGKTVKRTLSRFGE